MPGQPLGEYPRADRCLGGVWLEAVPAAPVACALLDAGRVSDPVPVGRAAAQVAALLAGLDGHRWRKNGLRMVAIGLGAAAAGFLIGRLFHTVGA